MGAFLLGRAPDLAWLIAPLVAHLAFSWIGFNPTDDGWLQAVARRLADGEVPHRDFIFVRPALSAILQVPLVWWAGEHVIAMSRLWGWLTLGAVCWLWTGRVAAGPGFQGRSTRAGCPEIRGRANPSALLDEERTD